MSRDQHIDQSATSIGAGSTPRLSYLPCKWYKRSNLFDGRHTLVVRHSGLYEIFQPEKGQCATVSSGTWHWKKSFKKPILCLICLCPTFDVIFFSFIFLRWETFRHLSLQGIRALHSGKKKKKIIWERRSAPKDFLSEHSCHFVSCSACRGCLIIIWTRLNIKILKWFSDWGIILPKGQLDHSYTYWTMPILIFSPVQIIMGHPLLISNC